MKAEEFEYQIYNLSDDFYEDYGEETHPEILRKIVRPYNCLLIKTKYDYYACIPYRTEINHDNAYKFKESNRSRIHKSGLDYSKMIIIKDSKYIGNAAVIDRDEYKETRDNIKKIADKANQYIDEYVLYKNEKSILSKEELRRKYQYTTLQYFHKEIGISDL